MHNQKRALISVSDKTGVIEFSKALVELGYEIISTGGTYRALADAGLSVVEVADVTGFAECLDGRVKTLHPAVHGGILAVRENDEHVRHIEKLGIAPIDLVCVNLYPFKETILRTDSTLDEAVENIDIGGPAMIRSAAKNYRDVTVIVDPNDYSRLLDELNGHSTPSPQTRQQLMAKAFRHTAAYDALIAAYFSSIAGEEYPEKLTLTFERKTELRYGENPHQSAAFYKGIATHSLAGAKQLGGKELSFNNINDAHGALELLREFTDCPAVVAVKHSTPCGVALGDTITEAYYRAYEADPTSIFGGVIAANREIDASCAAKIAQIFAEIILAPGFTPEALQILRKKKNLRLLEVDITPVAGGYDMKKVTGGLLLQSCDDALLDENKLEYVTTRRPNDDEMRDLMFALRLVKHVKSNGIALAKNGQSLGFGSGQTARIKSTRQAIEHAIETLGAGALKGAVMASDAFFPFDDCIKAAHAAGITAIIQPGGSVNDKLSITACNEYRIAMVTTGIRHFRH